MTKQENKAPLLFRLINRLAGLLGYEVHVAQLPSYMLPQFISWEKTNRHNATMFTFRKKGEIEEI